MVLPRKPAPIDIDAELSLYGLHLDRATNELWLEISYADILRFKGQYGEFVGRSRLFMAGLKSAGEIFDFSLFEDRLEQVWERLEAIGTEQTSVKFVFGCGFSRMSGVRVFAAEDDDPCACYLTIQASRNEIIKWRPSWLVYEVERQLNRSARFKRINTSHIHGAWMQAALNGEAIERLSIGFSPSIDSIPEEDDYAIKVSRKRRQVYVVFKSFKSFRTDDGIQSLLRDVRKAVFQLATEPGGSGYYHFLSDNLVKAIENARQGPQSIGLEIPLCVLGAITFSDALTESDHVDGLTENSAALALAVMREMVQLTHASFDVEWLQNKISMPLSFQAIRDLKRILERRGLVVQKSDSKKAVVSGKIIPVGYRICGRRPDDFHLGAMNYSASAIDMLHPDHFRNDSRRLALNEDSIDRIKKILADLRDKMANWSRLVRSREAVFQLNIQLFPLTRLSPDYRLLSLEDHLVEARGNTGEWTNRLVFELAALENFRFDPKWVAGKLFCPMTVGQAEGCLEYLKMVGALVFDKKRNRYVQGRKYEPIDKDGQKQREFEKQIAELGLAQLLPNNVERRDFSTVIYSCKNIDADVPFEQIKYSLYDIAAESEKSPGSDQLYQLGFQMVRHTI